MRLFFVSLIVVLIFNFSKTVVAGGATSYPHGSEDFMSGAVPPPGFYYIHYLYHYHSNGFKNNQGHDYNFGPLSDMRINVTANAMRFIYVSNFKLFGADIGAHTLIPVLYKEYDFGHEFNSFDDEKGGLGDIIVCPMLLAWHFQNVHVAFGPDIYMPTGRFDHESDMVNLSSKVWTVELATAVTVLLGPLDISSKFMYDFSSKNNDHIVNDYEGINLNRMDLVSREKKLSPGQEFHFDYAVGYNFASWITGGVNGYFYQQTTDDKIDGRRVRNMQGRTFAMGPAVKMNHKNISLVFKNLWEMETENRPQGYVLCTKCIIAF